MQTTDTPAGREETSSGRFVVRLHFCRRRRQLSISDRFDGACAWRHILCALANIIVIVLYYDLLFSRWCTVEKYYNKMHNT